MTQATGTYDEQGYRVFRQLLPLEAVNAIRERVFEDLYPSEAAFLRHPSVKRETNTWRERLDGTRFVANSLLNPHLQPETPAIGRAVLDLICSTAVADQLGAIDGDSRHTLLQIIMFFYSPITEMHIDGWGTDTLPEGGQFTLWIPLEPITPHNGPVGVFPWSPRDPVTLEQAGVPADIEDGRVAYGIYQEAIGRMVRERRLDCVAPLLDPGDMLIFSSLTPHVSLPPLHDRMSRMALQVLARPTSRPVVADMLSRTRGSIWTDDPDSLIMVNDRWFISPRAPS